MTRPDEPEREEPPPAPDEEGGAPKPGTRPEELDVDVPAPERGRD